MTALCQGTLAPAVLPGGRIDAAHVAVAAYAIERGLEPASLLDAGRSEPRVATAPRAPARHRGAATKPPKPSGEVLPPLADPDEVTAVLDLSLRQITDQHGSTQGLADFFDLRKTAAEIVRIEMANLEKAGTLIERERVRVHVFGYIEGAHKRILTDAVQTIIRHTFALARGNGTLEEAEKFARDTLTSIYRPARDHIVRTLRRKRKKDPDDDQ